MTIIILSHRRERTFIHQRSPLPV